MSKAPMRVAITGAAGQIGYSNAHGGFGHVSLLYETAWLKLFDRALCQPLFHSLRQRARESTMLEVRRRAVNSSSVLYKTTFRGRCTGNVLKFGPYDP